MNERTIFLAALEKSPQERSAFVLEACGDDTGLHSRVAQLLAAAGQQCRVLDQPLHAAALPADVPERPGAWIGPYKLREQIGEGGFGVVHVAEQQKPVARKVALKIIKPGMDTKDVIARFEAERQALAMMDHPHIAKVLDAGATQSGRPYFVMELVKGVAITEFCDGQKLANQARLELFVGVCRAVQHAHQKGVLHRDLKPSNVMVTLHDGRPVPKVIDFGVAKALIHKLTDKTVYTGYGQLVGTPLYMSPEQAQMSGLDVDTRSDVYSLGVLLYELLTGTTPFDKEALKEAGFDELRRIIREDEPPRPSARISTLNAESLSTVCDRRRIDARRLGRSYRGELDWIVMKALEKDRNRRYESAAALAADVERYLNDDPVQACPPSNAYRLGKFGRRHTAALTIAALSLVVLMTLAASIGWVARQRALRQAETSIRAEAALGEIKRLQENTRWREALEIARNTEALVRSGGGDETLRLRLEALVADFVFVLELEEASLTLWELDGGHLNWPGAERAYASAFQKDGFDMDRLDQEALAGRIRWSQVREELINEMWLLVLLRQDTAPEASVELAKLIARMDDDPWRRELLAASGRNDRAAVLRLARSEPALERRRNVALANAAMLQYPAEERERLLRAALRRYPDDFWINIYLFIALYELDRRDESTWCLRTALALRPDSASLHRALGEGLAEAGDLDGAVQLYRKAIRLRPDVAEGHNKLGVALAAQGHFDQAIKAYRETIRLEPHDPRWRNNLGNALRKSGRVEEAIVQYREAVRLQPDLPEAHGGLGMALDIEGRYEEAVDALREAIRLRPEWAAAHNNLGMVLIKSGELDKAAVAFREAIRLEPDYAAAHNGLGIAWKRNGMPDEAIEHYRRAIALDPEFVAAHDNLGLALAAQGLLDEAMASHRKAIELDPQYANAHNNLGLALAAKGRLDEAIASYQKAIEADPDFAAAHNNLGLALFHRNRLDEAKSCFAHVIELDPGNADACDNLGCTLKAQGQLEEAIAWHRKAIELDGKNASFHNNLGCALQAQVKLNEAIASYRKAIALEPEYAVGYRNLARALHEQNRLEDAVGCYRVAIALDPAYIPAHVRLGAALDAQHKLTDAARCYTKAIELDPNCVPAWRGRGWVRYRLGEWQPALDDYNQTLRLAPDDFAALVDTARLLTIAPEPELRDPDRALDLATRAVERNPESALGWQWLGWARLRCNLHQQAIDALNKSCQLQKDGQGDPWQWLALAMAHWELGAENEARSSYDRSAAWAKERAWTRRNDWPAAELRRVRAEAAQRLGIKAQVPEQPRARDADFEKPVVAPDPENSAHENTEASDAQMTVD